MDKQWLSCLASDITERYGKEAGTRIFGDIDSVEHVPEYLSAWFENFTTGLDELNDKEFLQKMMANRCPCGDDYVKDGQATKEIYDKSGTLTEFADTLRKWLLDKYGDADKMELRGNVLYMTKPLGASKDTGICGRGCHCWLAMHTDKTVSDTFCYCCTIGYTGRPFQVAFSDEIKMELIESIICGGKSCVMTVHLPEKDTSQTPQY